MENLTISASLACKDKAGGKATITIVTSEKDVELTIGSKFSTVVTDLSELTSILGTMRIMQKKMQAGDAGFGTEYVEGTTRGGEADDADGT